MTDFTGRDSLAAGMLLDSAGRPVVLAKTGPMELGLMRRAPDGSPGVATTASLGTGEASLLTDVVEQPGGGYLSPAAGSSGPRRVAFALVRFSDAGAFDAGFGVVTDTPGCGDDEIRALAIQPDGRIVAAGRSGDRIGVARYAQDGTRGSRRSRRVHDFTSVTEERANGVVVEPDGRILLAGTGVVDGDRRFLLAALTPDGAIDATFGAGGLVTLDVGDGRRPCARSSASPTASCSWRARRTAPARAEVSLRASCPTARPTSASAPTASRASACPA